MKIIYSDSANNIELPLQLYISFKQVFEYYKKYAEDEKHPYYDSAKQIREYLGQFPELIDGFTDFSLLKKYEDQIDLMLEGLFPEILTLNEIKAATVPFSFASFKFTERFENILENAGEDYDFKIRNLGEDQMYIMACTMILGFYYNKPIDLKRPFFFDIPDKKTGVMKHYRVAFNGDFMDIVKTQNAPDITEDDIKLLLDNYHNIDVWKEKFPVDSYIFKGFGLMNLFDVTPDETLSSIKETLLRTDNNVVSDLQQSLREFYNIEDLMLGYSIFDAVNNQLCETKAKKSESLILSSDMTISCNDSYFCQGIMKTVFENHEIMTISDVEYYGTSTHKNSFYKTLKSKGIGSIILVPIKATSNDDLALLEIASPRSYELNSVNQQKLRDIIPVFKTAVERASEERQNVLEATIQSHYTSIHPTVKWRFYEAAEKYQDALYTGIESPQIDDIVFNDVFPLFGQTDIKGSSVSRNLAIQEDLITQLSLAIDILNSAKEKTELPIYDELIFRITEYLEHVKNGLQAGDEVGILDFLKREIYPVFNHLKEDENMATSVHRYLDRLDPNLNVIYEKRKAYENSVTYLNNKLSSYIDKKQKEAQAMFPHYFERYKTDGVEYNMYIGQSLVKHKNYNPIYLYNLRLWQLQSMYEMEQVANIARREIEDDLQVASLILVHNNSLSIKFRMDEKKFDVDGAYNIRYEIIKKRIDKVHIKGTNERLTIPGKIAIVYAQGSDAREYAKYIKYLQAKGCFGELEYLELEDLQGVSGLKALRVEVLYQKDFNEKSSITIDELMEEFK